MIRWAARAAAAALALSGAARADQVFLREAEVPRALFGEAAGASERKLLQLTEAELAALGRQLGRKIDGRAYPYLEVRGRAAGDGGAVAAPFVGYVFLLDALGKSQPITFAAAVRPDGALQDLQVMVYREPYGEEIRERRFRAQFVGKRTSDPLALGKDIDAISGATISSASAAYAARKALALGEILRARAGSKGP